MKRVAIYARKSVYREGSLSVSNQISFCKEYMNSKYRDEDFEFTIFEDEGFTGSNTNRPQFLQLMKLIKLKKIDLVVCYKVDRIARNIVDFVNIFNQFQTNNVTLISITEGFDPNEPIGKMLMLFLASFAEMERMNIQHRVRDSRLALVKLGRWTGGSAPIGYRCENKTLVVENEEAIKEIFALKAARKDLSDIYIYINDKYNNMLSSTDLLLSILRKPIYVKSSQLVSDYLSKKGYKVERNYDNIHGYLKHKDAKTGTTYMCVAEDIKGVVDDKIWLQVQKIADSNNKRENSRFSSEYWLTKTLRCQCGCTYMGQTKKWNSKYKKKDGTEMVSTYVNQYYMCRDMSKGKLKTCSNTKRLRKDFIESRIESFILLLKKNKKMFYETYESTEIQSLDNDLALLNKNINKLDKQIELLTEKITFATMDVSKVLMLKMDNIIKEKNKLINTRAELELENIENKNVKKNKELIYESIKEFKKDLSVERKRSLAMNIFESIYYNPLTDEFTVDFN